LVATLARARRLDAEYMRASMGPPGGQRNVSGADLVADGGLDALFADGAGHCGGARDYLGASVAHMVTDGLLVAGLPAVLLEQRLPVVALDEIVFRRRDTELWFDRIWLASSRFWALPTDRDAGHSDAIVVADRAALTRLLVDQLVAALTPVFAAIRRQASFGVIGMWGQAVDGLYSLALWLAHRTGGDHRVAWDEASAIVDVLAERVPQARARPRAFLVMTQHEERLFSVRGTCCLWFKSQPEEPSAAYCTTCPLRGDQDRTQRLVRYLEEQTA